MYKENERNSPLCRNPISGKDAYSGSKLGELICKLIGFDKHHLSVFIKYLKFIQAFQKALQKLSNICFIEFKLPRVSLLQTRAVLRK